MSITQKFADFAFSFAKESSDDEYQEQMWYKSCAVAYFSLPVSLYSVGAILAWALPGMYSLLSILVIIPIVTAEFIGQAWLKEHAPRPRAHVNSKFMWVTLVPVALMIAGICFRLFSTGEGDMAQGMVAGAIVGAVLAGIFAPKILAKVRKSDEQRFDEELDQDDA